MTGNDNFTPNTLCMNTSDPRLSRVIVRPVIIEQERLRWNELMRTWHYLKSFMMIGEQLRYVAEIDGQWVALLGWSNPSLKSDTRKKFLGWSVVQERQRLNLVAKNARFLVLPGEKIPNLASRVLALNCERLSSDWLESYGHPVLAVETYVQKDLFDGTCYKAAGWEEIGETKGVERQRGTWVRHGVIKRVFMKELASDAKAQLISEHLDTDCLAGLTPQEVHLCGDDGLLATLKDEVKDPRKGQGRQFFLPTILGLLIAGMLAGKKDIEHIAVWAKFLPERILLRFRCPRNKKTGKIRTPCANSFRYLVQAIDPQDFDRAVRIWLRGMGIDTSNVVIAIDGKTIRGSASAGIQARKVVSLFLNSERVTFTQQEVPSTTSEVPLAREIIADPDLDIKDSIITTDAAHTCAESAEEILKKNAEYIMVIKGNQPNLAAAVVKRLENEATQQHNTRDHGRGHGRDEYRTLISSTIGLDDPDICFPGAKQIGQIIRDTTLNTGKTRGEVVQFITSLSPEKADPARLATLIRGHWAIENTSHWRRDETYGEDKCRARIGHSPINLATLRNITCALIAKHKPKRFDRLSNAIAGSTSAILAILALGTPLTLGYF